VFSRASCRRCGLSAVLIPVFLHSLGQERKCLGVDLIPLIQLGERISSL